MYAIGGSANPTINSQGNRYIAPPDPNAKEVIGFVFERSDHLACCLIVFIKTYSRAFLNINNLSVYEAEYCEFSQHPFSGLA